MRMYYSLLKFAEDEFFVLYKKQKYRRIILLIQRYFRYM